MSADLEQHKVEIEENRAIWHKKPLLRQVYSQFYRDIDRVDAFLSKFPSLASRMLVVLAKK